MHRIVPNLYADNVERSKSFYADFLGMDLVMDLGWIVTFASRENPTAQINISTHQATGKPGNETVFLSIEVSDVDEMHERAVKYDIPVVYPLTNESWGVRRFFVKDPNGATLNLLSHR